MNKKFFETLEEMSRFNSNLIADKILSTLEKEEVFFLGLSGGKTPEKTYRLLSEKEIPWDRVHLFPVDERFVDKTDINSNYRMINETLIEWIEIPGKNLHFFDVDKDYPIKTVENFERELTELAEKFNKMENDIPQFDIMLLGIGEDGHIASIFSGEQPKENASLIKLTKAPQNYSLRDRVTMNIPLINNSKEIIFLAGGKNKLDVIEREDGINYPYYLVKGKEKTSMFLFRYEG